MKVVIVEDEVPAANKLQKMLQASSYSIEIVKILSSIHDSLQWFKTNDMPDPCIYGY